MTRLRMLQLHLPGLLILAAALALPWSTRYAHDAMSGFAAVTETPRMLFVVVLELVLGLWIARSDRWLGVFVGYVALNALRAPLGAYPFAVSQSVAFGALAIIAVRRLPSAWTSRVLALLLIAGLAQVAFALLQSFGVDPLFGPAAPYVRDRQIPGSIGHGNWLGVFLAMLAPLGPAWLLPAFVVGILVAHSRLGLLALGVGILVKYRARPWRWCPWEPSDGRPCWMCRWLPRVGLALAPASLLALAWALSKSLDTFTARLEIWRLGGALWWSVDGVMGRLFGLGPGTWGLYVPSAQEAFKIVPTQAFTYAHNEPLQLLFEGGVAAVAIAALWFWDHRALLTGPAGGAVAALLVGCWAMFPMHLAQLAAPALVLVAIATKEGRP